MHDFSKRMRGVLNLLSGNSLRYKSSLSTTIVATRALIKFCNEHGGANKVDALNLFLAALVGDDREAAKRAFKRIGFGGMGSFADWYPAIVFEHETPEYVSEVFVALTGRFYALADGLLSSGR